MATTTLQHPTHHHPLVPLNFSKESNIWICRVCRRKISAEAYACHECWSYNYHRVCVEAPPLIERHPLHPAHPLALIHCRPPFTCACCSEGFDSPQSKFRCDECDFDLDIGCALSTLSDQAGSQVGKTSEHITLPLHPHPLTSFSTRHDFVGDSDCYICRGSVERDGYMCLRRSCEFIIHKGCIQDLHYPDGTKAPRVYHGHPLETFGGDDAGSRTCSSCGSDESDEFIGCASCEVFYHRHCFQVHDILEYRSHHPDHTLALFINSPDNGPLRHCQSCSRSLKIELCYRCTALGGSDENARFSGLPTTERCEFFLHVECALQVLTYCEEGMSADIKWTWHGHPLFLCHKTKFGSNYCYYCGDESIGPTYVCHAKDCGFLLHERCINIEPTMINPHHPDHLLTLNRKADGPPPLCKACCKTIYGLIFSCELCDFYLHAKCAARVPTRKHYLHEHELLRFDEVPSLECNRCGASMDSPLFRCVPCNFNLHEKCMELPLVVKHDTHVHPLTLQETYVEDDSGEYYCDLCEKRRDERLGVYVCIRCTARWAFHIECILPELQKVFVKNSKISDVKRLTERIARQIEQVHAAKEKLEETKRVLDELMKEREELISRESPCNLISRPRYEIVSFFFGRVR